VSEALLAIEDLLARHLGLDAQSVGSRAIAVAIGARMTATGTRDASDYLALLVRPEELARLTDEVVVPETWFWRDRVPFVHLASHAREHWKAVRPLRVLSVPSSTGEEPYTIAMALLDAGFPQADIVIDAVDVSERAIAAGRKGVYGPGSFRGEDQEFRGRWFRAAGEQWAVRAPLREAVTFSRGNILEPGAFEPGRKYHAIFCRNLLIYLTATARVAAIGRLEAVLEPGGLLVVGHAEALQVMDPRFRAVEMSGAFTFQRVADLALRANATGSGPVRQGHTTTRRMPALPKRKNTQPMVKLEAPATPAPAAQAGTEPRRDLLVEAAALADRGELAAAAELCEQRLRVVGADAAGYALLGTIRQAGGNLEQAEECFSRALYCDPGHYPSLVQLALLRERRGDRAGAANLRRRAAKARGGAQ
jgi:chemotaxis protein methyltransferase WspC